MISILGVVVGVWALTVVLSVLNGFGHDLRQKIVESTPNIQVDRDKGEFINYNQVCKKLKSNKEVTGCSPFLRNEVMISSRSQNAGVLLHGIVSDATRITNLTKQMRSGKFEYLFAPEKILEDKRKKQKKRALLLQKSDPKDKKAKLSQEDKEFIYGTPSFPLLNPKKEQAEKVEPLSTKRSTNAPKFKGSRPTSQGSTSKPSLKAKNASQDPINSESHLFDLLKPTKKKKKKYPGILLGQELARRTLDVKVGDVVRLVSPLGGSLTPMGPSPRIRKFRVAGIFFTGMYEYDTKFAFISLKSAQKLFGMRGAASGLEVSVKDIYQTPELKKRFHKQIGGSPYHVQDWIELNSQLFGALQMEKAMMFVILTFIILVASFNIVSTLFMIVLEKSQEIAILKSMGATRKSIMRIFMVEGLVIGVIGTVIGLFLGWRTSIHLILYPIKMNTDIFYIAFLPVRIHLSDFIFVAIASIVLSFLATIYPALQAAKLRPVEGLQHE